MSAKQKPEYDAITRKEWDDHFWQHFRVLRKQDPTRPIEECRKEAYSATEGLHGPRPPSWKWLLVKLGWHLVRSEGNVKWDWTKTLWKAVRGALGAALVMTVLAFFGAFDTAAELEEAGMPGWLAPAAAMLVAFIVSWIRNWTSVNHPEWNVVKKVGAKVQPKLKGS
jgi:hypothetical protein